jgi:phosphoserine phosphatase
MTLVATLVADPSNPVLTSTLAGVLAGRVSDAPPAWLAEGIAVDITPLRSDDGNEVRDILKEAIGDLPVDIVVQQAEIRRKRVLVADMDSTMIGQECVDELAAEIGIKDQVSGITRRAMNGEIEFEPALRERVSLLRGLDVATIDHVLATRITLTQGGRELVATMRANGGYTALVSGGFTAFTSRIAERLGFDENRANRLMSENGRLTGHVAEPILGRQAKVDTLIEICARLDIGVEQAMAVGDGANDLGMLQLAGSGVALHAKPSVAAQCDIRIDHADLTALLYIQGYTRDQFEDGS